MVDGLRQRVIECRGDVRVIVQIETEAEGIGEMSDPDGDGEHDPCGCVGALPSIEHDVERYEERTSESSVPPRRCLLNREARGPCTTPLRCSSLPEVQCAAR